MVSRALGGWFGLLVLAPALSLADEAVWLDLATPAAGESVRGAVALVEVSGRALRGTGRPYDLVLAIDLSESTLWPSGEDIDGDGSIGRPNPRGRRRADGSLRPHRTWTTDAGDTIARAELLAAQRMLRQLPADVRVGLVTFTGRARVHSGLRSPEEALKRLRRLRVKLDRSGTNLAHAVRRGVRLLKKSAARGRDSVLLLLSDGRPTVPAPRANAEDALLAEAERAAEYGIQVWTVGLGPRAARAGVFRSVARVTGGRFVPLENAGDVAECLPRLDIPDLAGVEISNRTTGGRARALRVFADGAFDALLPLVPGPNAVEIRARVSDGRQALTQRTVHFEPVAGDATGLRDRLRERSLETELAGRARLGRRRVLRQLEIDLESGPPPVAASGPAAPEGTDAPPSGSARPR